MAAREVDLWLGESGPGGPESSGSEEQQEEQLKGQSWVSESGIAYYWGTATEKQETSLREDSRARL